MQAISLIRVVVVTSVLALGLTGVAAAANLNPGATPARSTDEVVTPTPTPTPSATPSADPSQGNDTDKNGKDMGQTGENEGDQEDADEKDGDNEDSHKDMENKNDGKQQEQNGEHED